MIDVASNLLVGRGVQGALSFISYGATTDILMRIMEATLEATPVQLELFSSLTLSPSSIFTVVPLAKAIFKVRGAGFKFVVVWLTFSTAILLAMPTLVDTTTGYIQTQDIEILFHKNETNLPLDSFNSTAYYAAEGNSSNYGFDYICTSSRYNGYKWGFSSIWLVISWNILGVWLLGIYTLWMDAQHHSESVRKGRSMNGFRASSDIADAMVEILGPNTTAYSGKELTKALGDNSTVMYQTTIDENTGLGTLGLTSTQKGKMSKLCWITLYGKQS